MKSIRLLPGLVLLASLICLTSTLAADKPNIVYILADDLGYGDVKCLNPEGKIATPCMDKMGQGGMRFTDMHSSSSVCTPSRYSILTGRYNWRSSLKAGVLGGFSKPLIEPNRLTVAALLKQNGYQTACVGKWHLGWDWVRKEGAPEKGKVEGWEIDYSKPIGNGPTTVGFDYYYGISASLDMPPYIFIENDRCVGVPTVEKAGEFEMYPSPGDSHAAAAKITKHGRKGPAEKDFEMVKVLPTFTRKAVEYINQHAAAAKDGKPFFLYLPLNAPHTPIAPTPEWAGKSGLNPYADFVMQVDATVGELLQTLEHNGLTENTIVIMTSDNGCSPAANFKLLADKGHNPSYQFRGHKADIYDGGHRIPFLLHWPAKVKAGSVCDQPLCLVDLMATCADLVGVKLPSNAGEDSVSMLPAMTGTAGGPLRESVVHHSVNGSFSIRQANWKLELCPGSGGWSVPRPGKDDTSALPLVQLYDLNSDIGEKVNVQADHPEVVERLTKLLEKYVAEGRSTPGAPQQNTGAVDIWEAGKNAHRPLGKKSKIITE